MVDTKGKKIIKVVNHATRWVASTHNYFTGFLNDIRELQKLVDQHARKSLVLKELKQALKDFRYAARSEFKLNRFTNRLEGSKLSELYPSKEAIAVLGTNLSLLNLSQLEEEWKQIGEIKDRINVEGRHLVRMASFFEGGIRGNFNEIQALAEQYEGLRGDKKEWEQSDRDEKKLSVVESQIKSKLEELGKVVTEADKWLSALSSDLVSAKKVYRDFRIKQVVTPKKIGDIIAKYDSPFDKIEHLGVFLKPKAREAFSTAVNREVKRLIGSIATRKDNIDLLTLVARVYNTAGMADDAKKYLKKAFEIVIRPKSHEAYNGLNRVAKILAAYGMHIDAGDCYIEMARNMYRTADSRGAEWGYEEAAKEYNLGGLEGYKVVGIKLMKFIRERDHLPKDHYYILATDLFGKGGFFELEGDAWLELAEKDQGFQYHNTSQCYSNAIIAFKKAGNDRKAEKARNVFTERKKRHDAYWDRVSAPARRGAHVVPELRV